MIELHLTTSTLSRACYLLMRDKMADPKCFIRSCKHCDSTDCVKNLSPVATSVNERVAKLIAYKREMYTSYKESQK